MRIGFGAPSTVTSVWLVSPVGMVTTVVAGFSDMEFFGEIEIATGSECQGTTFR